MHDFILSCCSVADLTQEHFDKRNIKYLCFNFTLNGKSYKDDMGKSIPLDKFYKALSDGAEAKTSLLNADEYIDYFTPFLQNGKDILHICFSGGLSGSYNSAMLARDELIKKFPDRKLYVVDSLCASSGYGLLMDRLADLRDEGKPIDELYQWAEANKLRVHHLFFSTSLKFYIKGGRISKTAGIVGTLLNVCPLMDMSKEGKLVLKSKAIGKKSAMKKIIAQMENLADDSLCYDKKCYVCHSACIEDATVFTALVRDRFPKINGNIEIYNIGTTVGSHSGPGTIAIFFWGKSRGEE